MRGTILLLLFLLGLAGNGLAGTALDRVQFLTEEYPPFNFERAGSVQGAALDLLAEVFRATGSARQIGEVRLLPWARAYRTALETPGVCLFVMTRTAERERLFRWAGPVAATRIELLARKGAGVTVGALRDLRRYRIGVVRDDVGQQLLAQAGYPEESMDVVSSPEQNAEKLARGRIDAWAYEGNVARAVLAAAGQDPDGFETVRVLQTGAVYFAFSRGTEDAAVREMQAALDLLRVQGKTRDILGRYGLREAEGGRMRQKRKAAPR